jgi:DNA-directed RNA polymerase specialized sigma24 family protein
MAACAVRLAGGCAGDYQRHPHVSTPCWPEKRAAGGESPRSNAARAPDVAEQVAIVACARRELLLRVHRHRLRREDLEDCYSQATLELVSHAPGAGAFANRAHIANAIELRFLSRVRDRHRALGGRSPLQAALEEAASLADGDDGRVEVIDARASVEKLVIAREDLRSIRRAADRLTGDQRLVIGSQLADVECDAFCAHFGWSREKYRKVAQRGRARLRQLLASHNSTVPSGGWRSDERSGPTYERYIPHS